MSLVVTTAASSRDLTTTDRVRREIDFDDDELERVTDLIPEVSSEVEAFLDRRLAKEIFTEQLPSTGRARLLLSVTPVIAIAEVRLSGSVVAAADYELEDAELGYLFRLSGWRSSHFAEGGISGGPSPQRSDLIWEIDYTGGYWLSSMSGTQGASDIALPPALERIAVDLVRWRFQQKNRDAAIKSERIGDWSAAYEIGDSGMPIAIEKRLLRWAEVA